MVLNVLLLYVVHLKSTYYVLMIRHFCQTILHLRLNYIEICRLDLFTSNVKLAFESQISGDSQIRIQCFESATCSYKYLVGNGSRKSNFNTKLKLNITYR